MEEEVRVILNASLAPRHKEGNLAEAIRKYFGPMGGVDLELPPRDPVRRPPDFEE
jgi:hypothetical protein